MDVLVPELVHPGEERHRSVPDIPGVVDEPVPHLELGILEPERVVAVGDVERALVDGPGAREVPLLLLPPRVLDPGRDAPPHAADDVLELLALAEAVVGELVRVGDLLLGRADLGLLPLPGLPEDLLGRDLDRRGGLVLHPRGAGQLDLGVALGEEAEAGVGGGRRLRGIPAAGAGAAPRGERHGGIRVKVWVFWGGGGGGGGAGESNGIGDWEGEHSEQAAGSGGLPFHGHRAEQRERRPTNWTKQALFSSQKFSRFSVTSNLWSHAWSIK